jgi:hypothetical protein
MEDEGEMTSQKRTVPDLRALLIGIDCYMPNELSDGTFYRSLAGCVRDILKVEQFLRSEFGLTDERLLRLTASRGGEDNPSSRGSGGTPSPIEDEKPTEPPEQWPTYRNIVRAFRKLEESARPGEQIYIHYSGHGGKVKTLPKHRALIPGKWIDEALVPTDLGNDEGRYLRDIELAFLLQKLVAKGLYVTIVLDSCHSGSATRGEEVVVRGQTPANKDDVRGSASIDDRPKPSLVARDEELADNWQRLSKPSERDVYVGSDWLPDPQGYVLLAACRSNEGAHEFSFDGVNKEGALTHWFLGSLKKFGDGVTYRRLHRYIHARVSEQFRQQEPQNPELEGEGDRIMFGREPVQAPYAFSVLNADSARREVTLSAGRVHGLGAGARFALYSAGQVDFKKSERRLAIAEITEPGATCSLARLVGRSLQRHVEPGDQAVLLAPGTDTPRYTVRVIGKKKPVEQIAQLLRRHNEGCVQLIEANEKTNFIINVSPHNHFRICDSSGSEIPNLGPALSVADRNAPQRLVKRLLHLAQYRNVRELENLDPVSPLLRKFSVELLGVQADYKMGQRPRPQPVAETQGTPSVRVGEWIFLRARNHCTTVDGITLNVTVLNLRPDWSIQQVFPSRAGLFDTLEPTQELLVPLRFELPDGYDEGIDVIKFVATVAPADFHFFKLPPLDTPTALDHAHKENSIQHVSRSSERGSGESHTPDVIVPLHDVEDWTTRQFEVRVTR